MDATPDRAPSPGLPGLQGRREQLGVLSAVALGLLLALVHHLVLGHHDLGLQDEGFLWYGVQRTAAGEVPLRDFQAYEPGRYVWCAAWGRLFGTGIVGVRASVLLFGGVGLAFGLLALRRVLRNPLALAAAGVVLILWMFPRHKLFEPAIAMAAIWSTTRLFEQPSLRRHVLQGLLVGLAAFFGRNHALYLLLATVLAALLVQWRLRPDTSVARRLAALFGGGLLGSLPLLAMMAFVPGFGRAFLDSVFFFAERGSNVPYPVPWPWTVSYEHLSWHVAVSAALLGSMFLLLPLGYLAGAVTAARLSPERVGATGLLAAATCVGVFYAHHASVRSDPHHLSQVVHPLLIAWLALPAAAGQGEKRFLVGLNLALVAVVTVFVVFAYHPLLIQWHPSRRGMPHVPVEVAGETLELPQPTAAAVHFVTDVVGRRIGDDEQVLVVPTRPTYYCLLGKRSPTWRIYFLWPGTDDEQDQILEQLRDVQWVVISFWAVDNRRDMLFDQTYPRVWAAFQRDFVQVNLPDMPRAHAVYRRRR